jgi:flagellar biosynthesis protein FlhB
VADRSDKTEKATPKKRRESRQEGQIARSQDLYGWLAILIATFVVPPLVGGVGGSLVAAMEDLRRVILRPDEAVMGEVAMSMVTGVAGAVVLFLLVALGLAVVTSLGQVGFVMSAKSLKPKLSRLSPKQGIQRLFSVRTLWQALTGILKMVAIGLVTVPRLVGVATELVGGAQFDLATGLSYLGEETLTAVRIASGVGILIALADYGFQRWRTDKDMMMSQQDIKQEMRNSEGDPHVKARQRSLRLSASRNRMIASIADADVVITNPTHVAVALRYRRDSGAPRVVARGADGVAMKIRAAARENEVPIVESRPLARALYSSCELDHEVPRELFEGVALVLAFVQRLGHRAPVSADHLVEVPVSWDPALSDLDATAGRDQRMAARRRSRTKPHRGLSPADPSPDQVAGAPRS